MAIKLSPAVKYIKPMKVLSYGPTHSGKTYSSLVMAAGIVMTKRQCKLEEAWKHIILIDTEYGRGALHRNLGPYNYLEIKAPYHTEKLVKVIQELNDMKEIDVIVADSLTHFWVKEGGILDQKAAKDKQGGNSYTNWQDFTAKFNKMLDIILSSPKHIFTTARSKNDTVVVTDSGKAVPRTYGLKPELRDGIDFDFDIVFNVDKPTHALIVDKGVPGMESNYDPATPQLGQTIFDLFNADAIVPERTPEHVIANLRTLAKNYNMVAYMQLKLSGRKIDTLKMNELLTLEKELTTEIKRQQSKKK